MIKTKKNKNISIVAFDADDTLWKELDLYVQYKQRFYHILKHYYSENQAAHLLHQKERKNIPFYGCGLKSITLSMIETLCDADTVTNSLYIKEIITYGKMMTKQPVELLDGVLDVLQELQSNYKLALVTKGDLLDQQRKIKKSGLEKYFSHIEIMSDKQVHDYQVLFDKLACNPSDFIMVGNSIMSDILPVLKLGGYAIYVPYHLVWEQERYNDEFSHPNLIKIAKIREILNYL